MDQSDERNYLPAEREYFTKIEAFFAKSSDTYIERVNAFTRFVPRQALAYFLVRSEIFLRVLQLHGSILDFGVFRGSSFFTWLQLSSIYEPYNHVRRIVGFDTFSGFSSSAADDFKAGPDFHLKRTGQMSFPGGTDELLEGVALLDSNRPLGHVPRAHVIAGTLPNSCEEYLDAHPETVVALANFGLGLREPTLGTLQQIKPRLQRGAILVFEEIDQAMWPGETQALFEIFRPESISLRRNPICPQLSWLEYEP